MSGLDALFEGEEDYSEEPTVETEEVSEVETEQVETDDEQTESATTAPETDEDSPASPEKLDWAKVAYLDEKRKRQELEKRLEALEGGNQPAVVKKEVDIFEDPKQAIENIKSEVRHESFIQLTNLSRDVMMDAKPDYEEKEKVFVELAKADPALIDKMKSSSNPAKFAYETAVKHEFMQEVSDPVKYREKIKAELLAELTKSSPKQKVPSLAKTTSVGGGIADAEDLSLSAILGR